MNALYKLTAIAAALLSVACFAPGTARAQSILFIGNSFTFGDYGIQTKLADIIRQNDPATKIVLYETWAYPKELWVYIGKPPRFADQAEMLDQIAASYRTLAHEIGATAIAPVGDAFYEAETCPRRYDVYARKGNYHANDTGYTLSALVFVRTFYGKLPANPAPVLTGIQADDMQWLASIADANVRAWSHASGQ